MVDISEYIGVWADSWLAKHALPPWRITMQAERLIGEELKLLPNSYRLDGGIAVHKSAVVEHGAIMKAPIIIGPNAFVAANAYLRGGVYLDEGCIVGPSCELKTSIMFRGAKVAHLSFVGDSIIGCAANIEAGGIIANYRNEMDDKEILIVDGNSIIRTGVDKFGALIGDNVQIGANSVIAPGALISKHAKIPRLSRIDQHPSVLA